MGIGQVSKSRHGRWFPDISNLLLIQWVYAWFTRHGRLRATIIQGVPNNLKRRTCCAVKNTRHFIRWTLLTIELEN